MFLSQFTQMNSDTKQTVTTLELDYSPNSALHYFEPISHLDWAMLLRSCASNHPNSRYDILVANPVAVVQCNGSDTSVSHIDGSQGEVLLPDYQPKGDPFAILQNVLDTLLPRLLPNVAGAENPNLSELPFIGGALGYFSYDLGRRVESIQTEAIDDIQLPEMAVGIYSWALIVDHHLSKVTLVASEPEAILDWLNQYKQQHSSSLLANSSAQQPFKLTSRWQSNLSKHQYSKAFESIQNYLHNGDCYQINLAQRFEADYTGNEWLAYLELEAANNAPFSAYVNLQSATILSVSPERFIQLDGQLIETKPIKGTRPRSQDANIDKQNIESLVSSEKDQAENLMIVDLLRNDIGRVAKAGSVRVPELFSIESFPAVHHLVSTIRAELDKSYSATDLLRASFPGGSITGAPKVRAMQIIEQLEPHRRSVYCGSIGYISRCGKMDTSITIRTLIAKQNKIYAWGGGGIVADSICDSEYQETFDKLSRILPILEKLNH